MDSWITIDANFDFGWVFSYGCGVICLLIHFVRAFIWVGLVIGLLCVSCLLFIYALVFGFVCIGFGFVTGCYCWFWFDLVRLWFVGFCIVVERLVVC